MPGHGGITKFLFLFYFLQSQIRKEQEEATSRRDKRQEQENQIRRVREQRMKIEEKR